MRVNSLTRTLTAELIGTVALVFAGAGAVMVDAKTGALGHVGVAISFGLVIMVMIYALALDAMFGAPISGASMNPARSLGPALASGDLHALWIYLTAPFLGTALGALAYQFLRGEETRPAELHATKEAA